MATFLEHLMGYLYSQIIEEQNNFMSFIVVSGAGNTSRTGKSLMSNMWQLVFYGTKSQEGKMSISEAAIFRKLDKGVPVFSKCYISSVFFIGKWRNDIIFHV